MFTYRTFEFSSLSHLLFVSICILAMVPFHLGFWFFLFNSQFQFHGKQDSIFFSLLLTQSKLCTEIKWNEINTSEDCTNVHMNKSHFSHFSFSKEYCVKSMLLTWYTITILKEERAKKKKI